MSYSLDNGWIIPVGLVFIVSIIGIIFFIHGNVQITKKECACEIPKNEVIYSIVDDRGNVIKQVSKSELKQIK
jgi:hypothetical protein